MTFVGRAKIFIGLHAPKNKAEVVNMHITSLSNEWNKLAIQLVSESMKLPTQRKTIFGYPSFPDKQIVTASSNMTTDEWNKLALSLVDSPAEKK